MDFTEATKAILTGVITLVVGILLWDKKEKHDTSKENIQKIGKTVCALEARLDDLEKGLLKLGDLKGSQSEFKDELKDLHSLLTDVRIQLAARNVREQDYGTH